MDIMRLVLLAWGVYWWQDCEDRKNQVSGAFFSTIALHSSTTVGLSKIVCAKGSV